MEYVNSTAGYFLSASVPIDRRLLLTKAEMLDAEYEDGDSFFVELDGKETILPDTYFALCIDDGCFYVFNHNNPKDAETGYYKKLEAGIKDVVLDSESLVTDNIAHIPAFVKDVLVDGVSVVNAVNKAEIDLSGKQDLLEAKDGLKLDGNEIGVDKDTLAPLLEDALKDVGFIDKAVLDLENYYLKSETYTQDEVNALLGTVTAGVTIEVVAVLPITGEANKIYFVRHDVSSNFYDQYIWFNNAWLKIGDTNINLDNYYTKDEVDDLLDDADDKLDRELAKKQDTLVAGSNITITGNVISATGGSGGGSYTAGAGININAADVISAKVDNATVHTNAAGEIYVDAIAIDAGDGIKIEGGKIKVDRTTVPTEAELEGYQKKLTAGANILIDPATNTISATGGGSGGGANWGSIGGSISTQTDLVAELAKKADATSIPTKTSQLTNDSGFITAANHDDTKQDKLVAGTNISISGNVISATGDVSVAWGKIGGVITNQTDLVGLIDSKVPEVGKGSVQLKNSAGTLIGAFNVNQDTSKEITIPIPTKVSQLTNDEGFVKGSDIPTVPTKMSELINDEGYAKRSEIPYVPTKVSELTNDAGYVTSAAVPTKTSQLVNDSGFVTHTATFSYNPSTGVLDINY